MPRWFGLFFLIDNLDVSLYLFTLQVSQLKQNQVEFESTKHETLRLRGDLEDLNMQLEELGGLKSIVEAKLGEALQVRMPYRIS